MSRFIESAGEPRNPQLMGVMSVMGARPWPSRPDHLGAESFSNPNTLAFRRHFLVGAARVASELCEIVAMVKLWTCRNQLRNCLSKIVGSDRLDEVILRSRSHSLSLVARISCG